jgi:hypothetical protein
MRLRLTVLVAVSAAVCAGVLATGASARFQQNSVVPLFCTNDTIPGGTELKLRMRWVVRNVGQIDKFLGGQKLAWTVTSSDGTVLASRVPTNPEYGDLTYWSPGVRSTGQDFNGDGTPDDVWYADYLAPTGVTLAAGQTVTVSYTLTANVKTDDGFYKGIPAYSTIASGTTCTVTGV